MISLKFSATTNLIQILSVDSLPTGPRATMPIPADQPPRKKHRKTGRNSIAAPARPTLFAPFRALGIITNHVSFAMQARSYKGDSEGPKLVIVTSMGKAWAMWEGGKMSLLFVSKRKTWLYEIGTDCSPPLFQVPMLQRILLL
jgi:hypothetical protein